MARNGHKFDLVKARELQLVSLRALYAFSKIVKTMVSGRHFEIPHEKNRYKK
jgi:hypothetical protein